MPLPPGYEWTGTAQRMQQNGYVAPSFEEIEADKEEYNASEQLFSEWDWQGDLGPNGEALPELATGWKPNGEADYGPGLKGWWNKATSRVRNAWQTGYQEGLKISGITEFAVNKLNPVDSKNNPEDAAKTLEAMKEARKPKDENAALWAAAAEGTKEVFNQALWGLLDGLSVPAIATEQALGSVGLAIDQTIAGEDVDWQRNWDASRLAYSAMFDANITAEMNRRLDAGIRSDLAAQEVMIQNPNTMWPELIGQVLLDPLNVVTVFTKAGAAAKIQKSVSKTFHEVTNPAIAKMLDDIGEISKLDDAQAYQRIDELVKSQQALITATSHAEDIATAGKDLEALSNSYKIASLTRDGKVAHLANETGEILMHVVNNSSPDEALEIIRGMVKSVSTKTDEAAEGISAMLHFADPKALFSKAGNDTTVLLAKMFEKHGDNWLKNLDALKGKPVELTKDLLGKLDEVGEEMFPSVSKMLDAEKLAAKGGEVSDATKALAERAKNLPQYVKNATRFHDTAQKVVGPINKFFIGAYMGWSPGYAFRNFSNNSLQLLIDYGPGVLLGKADDMFSKVEKLHGGILQGAFSEGGQAASLFPDAAKVGENARNTSARAIIDSAKQKGLKGPVLGMSQTLEANAAKRIIAKTYRQTFDKGVGAMVKSLTPDLRSAGFSEDIIKKLPTYILQNDGDATKVIDALRADVSSGVIDLFNDISRIDPKYKGFLETSGKWDEYSDAVLKAATREEAETAAKKIFDDLAQAGDYAYRDPVPANTVEGQFLKMAEKEGLPETRGQLVNIRTTQNSKAIEAAEEILREADSLASSMGIDFTSLKKARKIHEITGWGADAAQEARRLRDLAWEVTRSTKGKYDLTALRKIAGNLLPDSLPANADARTIRDALWHQFDGVMSSNWAGARDTAIDNVTGYLDDLEGAGAQIPKQWKDTLKQAQEGAAQYDSAMVGRFGELVEETAMPYGSRTSQINLIAAKNGVPTATAEGLATDKKTLAIINKYADVSYKSLEDVPLDVAEQAFAKKAGKGTVKEVVQAAPTDSPRTARYAELNTKLWDPKTPRSELDAIRKEMGELDNLTPAGVVDMESAVKVPRGELPPEVSTRFEDEANRMLDELNSGTGPTTQQPKQGTDAFQTTSTPSTNADWYKELPKSLQNKKTLNAALEKIIKDKGSDKGINVERLKEMIVDRFRYGTDGAPPDLKVLRGLGADDKVLQEALDDYNDFTKQSKTLDELLGGADEVAEDLRNPDLPYYDDAGNLVQPSRKRILPPPSDGEMPTAARAIHEQMDDVGKMRQWVMDDITKNFGKKQVTDKLTEQALQTAQKELTQKLAETRLISSRVAQANRDFTLLNYGDKSYWDVALAYLYPFHFWYKGTYGNWLKRIAQNPAILAHYSKYKENLGTVHAGMPEWWKYNINTNDLPGVDVENPLYFNLEATLWPLNGITGMDFNDSSKRVNAWTYGLDYLNKFGPSTWTPLSMVTGLALYAQGEKEAGDKWMGRLFPQSATIKAGASLLGKANLETDPFVGLLQGGLDPYERGRVGRALAAMEQEALKGDLPYTQEQIQDAAYSQEGAIWDEAVKRAVRGRAPAQMQSFLFGVGFKGRTAQDMEIDKFHTDYQKLFTMRPNLSPEEFREGMDAVKKKYPFMDTVLLSKRDGVERDAGLAYMVMSRIPPGKSSDITELAGIDSGLLEKFYADKGAIEKWSPGDRQKFMSGVLNIAAVLEIPSDMTRGEWTKAKNAYSGMSTEAKKMFGENILDMADGYYQAKTIGTEAANAYLENNPQVEQYMNWKSERIMNSPILSAYYGGASMIENYYRSQQYADIEKQLGEEIFDVLDEYNDLKTFGEPAEVKTFYNQHRAEIKKYYEIKDAWAITINQQVSQLSAHLPEGEGVSLREDIDVTNYGAQNLAGQLQPEEQPTFEDFQAQIPERLLNLTMDYFYSSEPLPASANKQLERLAREMGYGSTEDLLQAIGSSLYTQNP
jgi:hypothetical protein